MSKLVKPNIFTYQDHIQFLNDWFAYLKKTETQFSMRNFSNKVNVSIGYMSMVLKRERELSEKGFLKISASLGLKEDELKFLNLLRIVGQAEDSVVRLQAVNEMMSLQRFKANNKNENRTYEYLTKWYFVAIYEMFNLVDFQFDPEWIRSRLRKKLSLSEVKSGLDFLVKNHFVIQNENGTWSQAQAHLNCTEGIFKVSLAEFHKQMLDLAHESIHTTNRDNRLIMGQTMAISKSDFAKIKDIIQNAISSVNEVNKQSIERDEVIHIEIAAFPLSKRVVG